MLTNIMQVAVGKQLSCVFKNEQKMLTSEILTLVHTRTQAVVVEREVLKINWNFEIGYIGILVRVTNNPICVH